MMHGTVKEISTRLTELFDEENPLSVLIWTMDDVMNAAECMDITEREAGRVLSFIADEGDHRRYGIGREAVRDMLNNLREEEREEMREVSVPAGALAAVLSVAEDFMRLKDAQAGPGAGARHWPVENVAMKTVMTVLAR